MSEGDQDNTGQKSQPLSILVLNQNWFVDELRARGHRVVSAGRFYENLDIRFEKLCYSIEEVYAMLPSGFEPDCIVYYDDSWPVSVYGLEKVSIPTVFYSVDSHHHLVWHSNFGALFDKVLVALKDYVPSFQNAIPQVEWFPLWAPVDMVPSDEKTIDVCFRGTLNPRLHPERAKFFDELGKLVSIDCRQGAYTTDYPRSKIIINQAVKDDVNFRIFEAAASGALLITPRIPNGLTDLFKPDEEIVLYNKNDVQDAYEKISYYLGHEEERAAIARRGFERVRKCHSKVVRAQQMESILLNLTVTPREKKSFGAGYVYCLAGTRYAKAGENRLAVCLLEKAVDAIIKSAEDQESFSEKQDLLLLEIKFELEGMGRSDLAKQFLGRLYQHAKKEPLVTAAFIHSILLSGDVEDVVSLAAGVSAQPEKFVAEVPSIIERCRKQVLARES